MRLAYAILLPDDVHNLMRRAQAELYKAFRSPYESLALPPHITIKQPFEAVDITPHEDYLDRLVGETEPFDIIMRGWGTFDGEGVVFLDVEQDRRLVALQRRLLEELGLEPALFEDDQPVPYHFHGTVAIGLTSEQLAAASRLLPEAPDFRFPLERIGLFRHVGDVGWLVHRRASVAAR